MWHESFRAAQIMPADSRIHLYMGGRGIGKTRAGVNFLLDEFALGARYLSLVGASYSDLTKTLLFGAVGLQREAENRGIKMTTSLNSGLAYLNHGNQRCTVNLYTANSVERLRGNNSQAAFCDEVGSWLDEAAWTNLLLGLRDGGKGAVPRVFVATTPRRTKLMKRIIQTATSSAHETTYENAANLPDSFLEIIRDNFEGTRLGQQEILGEFLDDVEGALFAAENLRTCQGHELETVCLGVDPALGAGENHDETGIVAVGIDRGNAHILGDWSGRFTPEQIPDIVEKAVREVGVSRIVVESNAGGDWVVHPIRERVAVPVRSRAAAKSKQERLARLSARAEQGRLFLCTELEELKMQALNWVPGESRFSPDRLDAAAWAFNEIAPKLGYAGIFSE